MKVVVFIDVQNDFIDGALGVDKDHKITDKIVTYAYISKCEHVPLFATRDTHDKHYLKTLEGKKLPVKHCIEGTEGWKLFDGLAEHVPVDNIVDKCTFGSDTLAERLDVADDSLKALYGEKNGITEIELCGYCASICVISNALVLRAAFPNLKITILKNLCGDINEESMDAALTVAKNCQIDIADAIV